MASKSDSSFGNKLAKGQQILQYVKTLLAYKPPHEALSIERLEKFLKQISEANNKVANSYNLVAEARATRLDTYYGREGIKKRAAMIRDFVGILPAGKNSPAYMNIQKECQKMSSYKKPSKKEENADNEVLPIKKTVSTSETSFGSILQSIKNIGEVVKNIVEYNPTNELITKKSIEAFILFIENANQTANTQQYVYADAIQKRQELYEGTEGLRYCFQNIKSFIAANFGKSSAEFKEVSKIKY